MSVELYAEEIVVVAQAEEASDFKIWLRMEAPNDLVSDLHWLCEEYLDYHIIIDLAHQETLGSADYKGLMDLRDLTEECDYRFVLCGLSTHLKWQLKCVHLANEFDMFDTREAAITELEGESVPT